MKLVKSKVQNVLSEKNKIKGEESIVDLFAKRRGQVEGDEDYEDYFDYLDGLRESGVTNMFGAGSYLQEEFGLDKREARKILTRWMETFGERHPKRNE